MTDFGMAKYFGTDNRHTPTYCPGTNGYMSPEALADPPSYTNKLDIFSCGVLFVQLITRMFSDPGPQTISVEVHDDSRFPLGRARVEIPEMERRRKHLDLISPMHSLLQVALDCIKDKEDQRPTAEQLCDRMIDLKESAAYHDSVEQTQSQALSVVDQEQDHKMRDTIEALTKQAHELQVHELNAMNQQLKEQINQEYRDSAVKTTKRNPNKRFPRAHSRK